MTAARIARRLVCKIVKPAALWLTARAVVRSDYRADYLYVMRGLMRDEERAERERTVRLIGRRNQIRGW